MLLLFEVSKSREPPGLPQYQCAGTVPATDKKKKKRYLVLVIPQPPCNRFPLVTFVFSLLNMYTENRKINKRVPGIYSNRVIIRNKRYIIVYNCPGGGGGGGEIEVVEVLGPPPGAWRSAGGGDTLGGGGEVGVEV